MARASFGKFALLYVCQYLVVPVVWTIPLRGNYEWTLFLCKFQDDPFEPKPTVWFEGWLTDESVDGSVANFFLRVSNAIYTVRNSKVHGWYSLPYTKAQVMELAVTDRKLDQYKENDRKLYFKTKEVCVSEGIRQFSLSIKPGPNIITVINDETTALFCRETGVLITPRFTLTAALTHEMGHSFHLGHSFSDRPVKIFPYAAPGEYDDQYDLMSTAHAYMYTSTVGFNGPGFSGPHLDYLGWLPANRIYYFGKDGPEQRLTLASLSGPHRDTKDWLLIILPYDRDDPLKYYTLEYRTKHFVDSGIPRPGVLVHRTENSNGFYYAKLLNQGGPFYDLVEGSRWNVVLNANFGFRFIKVTVETADTLANTITLLVHSTFTATSCANTETQRLAFAGDLTCVTDEQRRFVDESNSRRTERLGSDGQCVSPYVKRVGFLDDDVCVTPAEKTDFQNQNERWKRHQNFFHSATFGVNKCFDEMVWRQIDAYDYVCVTKSRRDEILLQNSLDQQRKSSSDARCLQGFVFRNALPNGNDNVCVSESEATASLVENQKFAERLVYYRFFNGEDEL